MSRRRRAVKRPIRPDARYHSELVGRLVNTVMRCGKRSDGSKLIITNVTCIFILVTHYYGLPRKCVISMRIIKHSIKKQMKL